MAATPSRMVQLGTPAPEFELKATNSRMVRLEDFSDAPVLVVIFMCNHCPFVKHLHEGLVQFQDDYVPSGVAIVGINSNDVENHPDDSFDKMVEEVEKVGYRFPYLFDETQEVAHAYNAACTPDFFVYDRERKLAYRGQFDESRPGKEIPVSGKDLRTAVDALLAGEEPPKEQRASIGCNIKWKPGNEPK